MWEHAKMRKQEWIAAKTSLLVLLEIENSWKFQIHIFSWWNFVFWKQPRVITRHPVLHMFEELQFGWRNVSVIRCFLLHACYANDCCLDFGNPLQMRTQGCSCLISPCFLVALPKYIEGRSLPMRPAFSQCWSPGSMFPMLGTETPLKLLCFHLENVCWWFPHMK